MRTLFKFTNIFLVKYLFVISFIFYAYSFSNAQSTNQNAATPVTSNEISGTIRARDIGDSRLTNYFYTFNGNQGDVFINVVTKNLDGDIDVFTVDGLKPLTKITIFSDNSDNETGRIIYLRKFEKLLLRIQGRSPNDEPATFKIKFAGSFQPLQNVAGNEETKLPEIDAAKQGEFRVNSVGTIIEPVNKPVTKTKENTNVESRNQIETPTIEKEKNREINIKSVDEKRVAETSTKIEIKREKQNDADEKNVAESSKIEESTGNSKPVLIITEDPITNEVVKEEKVAENSVTEKNVDSSADPKKEPVSEKTPDVEVESVSNPKPLKTEQLQKIELVVKFRDGKTINQPMSKVFSFNVNQGILTIILYDGKVSRYSLLDIEKISIEGN